MTDDAREVSAGAAGGGSEVLEKAKRRRFEAAYKLHIVEEADGAADPGAVGALLRREGLYSSHLASWRRQRDEGSLAGLAPKRRGRKAKRRDPLTKENEKLRREIQRLGERLRQAETIIEVQKKVSEMLGIALPSENGRSE